MYLYILNTIIIIIIVGFGHRIYIIYFNYVHSISWNGHVITYESFLNKDFDFFLCVCICVCVYGYKQCCHKCGLPLLLQTGVNINISIGSTSKSGTVQLI